MTENRTEDSPPSETVVGGSARWTTGRLIVVVLVIAAVWNVVGNLWLPWAAYIPANLAVAGLVLFLARRAGLTWDELGLGRSTFARGLLLVSGPWW